MLQGIEPAHWDRIQSVAIEVHDIERRIERVEEILRRHGITRIRRIGGCKAFGEHDLWVVLGARG